MEQLKLIHPKDATKKCLDGVIQMTAGFDSMNPKLQRVVMNYCLATISNTGKGTCLGKVYSVFRKMTPRNEISVVHKETLIMIRYFNRIVTHTKSLPNVHIVMAILYALGIDPVDYFRVLEDRTGLIKCVEDRRTRLIDFFKSHGVVIEHPEKSLTDIFDIDILLKDLKTHIDTERAKL